MIYYEILRAKAFPSRACDLHQARSLAAASLILFLCARGARSIARQLDAHKTRGGNCATRARCHPIRAAGLLIDLINTPALVSQARPASASLLWLRLACGGQFASPHCPLGAASSQNSAAWAEFAVALGAKLTSSAGMAIRSRAGRARASSRNITAASDDKKAFEKAHRPGRVLSRAMSEGAREQSATIVPAARARHFGAKLNCVLGAHQALVSDASGRGACKRLELVGFAGPRTR